MAGTLTRRKSVSEMLAAREQDDQRLRKDLGARDVLIFGIGVIIGAGIFVLTGVVAATKAGPAVTLSFVLAAFVCVFAGLCYAEFAAMVPISGSAYTYSYATLGEFVAFIIGWELVLEFTVGAATIAIGWSGYLNSTLDQIFGVTLPDAISGPPGVEGGVVNLPGIVLVVVLTAILIRGIRMTARANAIMASITVTVLLLVIIVGAGHVDTHNWSNYFPFGVTGIASGAALVFFAYIGFDVVATVAEETRNPQRNMPIGILGSLAITTVLYVAVAAVVTGMVIYKKLNSAAPVAEAFTAINQPVIAALIFAGALTALTNATLIMMLGQSRVAYAMARDRLIPAKLAVLHPKFGTPYRLTLITSFVVAVLAGVTPIRTAAELVNIGTLGAFIIVSIGIIVLRKKEPDLPRPFRTPWVPVVPMISVLLAFLLIITLNPVTWIRFGVWMAIGLVVYFTYGRKRSLIGSEVK